MLRVRESIPQWAMRENAIREGYADPVPPRINQNYINPGAKLTWPEGAGPLYRPIGGSR